MEDLIDDNELDDNSVWKCKKCGGRLVSNEGDTGGVDTMLTCSKCGDIRNFFEDISELMNRKPVRVVRTYRVVK